MIIAVAACGGLVLINVARKRAERAATEALLAKTRAAARKSRVPEVSNNLKGVTASQTISPLKAEPRDRAA